MLQGKRVDTEIATSHVCLGMSSAIGEEFFCYLMRQVVPAVGADSGIISRIIGKEGRHLQTVAALIDGELVDNFDFPMEGTPCADVLEHGILWHPSGVMQMYPRLPHPSMKGESYIGLRIVDYEGTPLGTVSLMKASGTLDDRLAESLLNMYSLRIAAELERENAIRSQREQLHLLQEIINAMPHPVYYKGMDGAYLGCNSAFEKFSDRPRHEIIGRTVFDVAHHEMAGIYHSRDRDLLRSQAPQVYENTVKTGDGSHRDMLFSKAKFSTSDGALSGIVGTIIDITERKDAERKIYQLANYDPLTALPNRTQFLERLDHLLLLARRQSRCAAVMAVDFDNFKAVNETLGHASSEKMIQIIAKRFARCSRGGDLVARIEGNKFAIAVSPLEKEQDAAFIASRILGLFTRPMNVFGREIKCRASIGVSLYPSNGLDAETLLKNADTALYLARKKGRGHFQFHNDEMNRDATERISMETSLRQGIKRKEFFLHYQPQVDLVTEEMVGVEALIRWNHPERGLVSPLSFIPLAEETGLIIPLGDWVIRTACLQNKSWQNAGHRPVRMAVNISSHQLRVPGFVDSVRRILKETELDGNWLEFELTETVVMTNIDQIVEVLHRLKEMGISISIDDFGTGYSSLEYLKRFPIDKLKMDRSYLKEIPMASDDVVITEAIIAMANGLGIKVLAEGVETKEQVEFLRARKCDKSQGYYFGRPMLPADVENLFDRVPGPKQEALCS